MKGFTFKFQVLRGADTERQLNSWTVKVLSQFKIHLQSWLHFSVSAPLNTWNLRVKPFVPYYVHTMMCVHLISGRAKYGISLLWGVNSFMVLTACFCICTSQYLEFEGETFHALLYTYYGVCSTYIWHGLIWNLSAMGSKSAKLLILPYQGQYLSIGNKLFWAMIYTCDAILWQKE